MARLLLEFCWQNFLLRPNVDTEVSFLVPWKGKPETLPMSMASLAGLPDFGFAIYISLNCAIWALLWCAITNQHGVQEWNPHYLAFLASAGPTVIAQIMANLTESSKRSIFYPFHKDGWKTISGHVLISTLACIGPVYVMVHMLLSNPGDSFYFWLRV